MKVYIATRFKGAENKPEVEALLKAVHDARLIDVSFVRDVEQYKHTFDDPKELWRKAYDEIAACDALLIDVSDHPSGGRLVEAGIAYALSKTVIIVKRHGVEHKSLFDGIAQEIITYHDYADLTRQLKHFYKEQTFNLTDRTMLLAAFLAVGGVVGYLLAQLWIPLGVIGAVVYWLVVRFVVPPLRAYDRIVIYIPLVAIWAGGYLLLNPINMLAALAWVIIYWAVVLPLLQRAKFSL